MVRNNLEAGQKEKIQNPNPAMKTGISPNADWVLLR